MKYRFRLWRGPDSNLSGLSAQWQPLSWAEVLVFLWTAKWGTGVARDSPSFKVCQDNGQTCQSACPSRPVFSDKILSSLTCPFQQSMLFPSVESERNCYCASDMDARLNQGPKAETSLFKNACFISKPFNSLWVENGCNPNSRWRRASHLCHRAGWIKRWQEVNIEKCPDSAGSLGLAWN